MHVTPDTAHLEPLYDCRFAGIVQADDHDADLCWVAQSVLMLTHSTEHSTSFSPFSPASLES